MRFIRHCLILLLAGLTAWAAQAGTLSWDGGTTNIAANGDDSSQGGTGLWNTTIQNWDQGAGLPHVTWSNTSSNSAVFGGTNNYAVTLSESITLKAIVYTLTSIPTNKTTTTIVSNLLNFTAGGAITNVDPSSTVGGTLTIAAGITGSPSVYIKALFARSAGQGGIIFQPATSNQTLGAVTIDATVANTALNLGGSTTGNTVASLYAISVGNRANLITKEGTSTWTINKLTGTGYTSPGRIQVSVNQGKWVASGVSTAEVITVGNAINDDAVLEVNSSAAAAGVNILILQMNGGVISNSSGGTLLLSGTSGSLTANGGTFSGGSLDFGARPFVFTTTGVKTSTVAVAGAAATVTIGGTVSDAAGATNTLLKAGAGTLKLNGNATYRGHTVVNSGTLILNGTNTLTGRFIVNGGTLTMGHRLALPNFANITVGSGATLRLDFAGTNVVNGLTFNGVSQASGYYDSSTSSPSIAGTGAVFVKGNLDTDSDGMPDWWMLVYFGHNTGSASDLSRAQDDHDDDGLTNLQEYQLGLNPLSGDTDGDGLSDGSEVNVYLTNPLVGDTDGDGLSDGDEVNVYYTNPLQTDTDGDGASDWYEVAAAYTDPLNAADAPVVPYPLPKPGSSTGATNKPVKVFILLGQSNMVGQGFTDPTNTPGTLATIVKQQGKFSNLLDTNGNWTVRYDVIYTGVVAATVSGPLTPGIGNGVNGIGPELGFGHVMGYYLDEPVLLIKSAEGGQSLGFDFLPPGSPRYTTNGTTYAGYGDWATSWPATNPPPTSGTTYAGHEYDTCVAAAQGVLTDFNTRYPQFAAQGYALGGFAWWQGWNDGLSYTPVYANRYETNMVNFIKAIRADFNATNAPFVLATCAFQGYSNPYPTRQAVVNGQLAVGDPVKHPEFAGTVKTMEARGYWRSAAESPANVEYHYNRSAEIFMLVGDALGRGMIELLQAATPSDYAAWATNFPGANLTDPNADYDGDGLSNDAERLFGLNPVSSASFNPITFTSGLPAGTLQYTRRSLALTGYAYTVWTSTDLKMWTQDTGAVQTPGVPIADVETVMVSLSPALLTESQLFVKMRAGP